MNRFFSRKKQPQPIITQPETVKTVESVEVQHDPDDQPFTAVEQARQVHPELMQMCSFCGAIGATHQFTNGDLYLGRLPHNYLCDTCQAEREAKRTRHNVANKNTVLEHQAVTKRPRKPTLTKEIVPFVGGVTSNNTWTIV